MTSPKRFAEVGDFRIAHYDHGSGPAILLIHGLPTSCYLWRDVIPSLAENYRVVAPDLLGLGDTQGPQGADHSLLGQATLLIELLRRLDITRVLVVGHDIGGGVAQLIALNAPRRVRGLALIDSVAYDNWPVPMVKAMQRLARSRVLWRGVTGSGLLRFLTKGRYGMRRGVRYPGSLGAREIEEYLRPFQLSARAREHLRALLVALTADSTIGAGHALATIHVSSLVVWGIDDAFLPPLWGQRLAADLPRAELQLIPDCGHFVPEEKPEELGRILRAFAERVYGA